MRPNEAASALAAAAAAAVLEATGATPDLNAGGPQGSTQHVPRFSGVNNGGAGVGNGVEGSQGTSSEDGEFFFPRANKQRLAKAAQESTAKVQRKKLIQAVRKGSLSNSGNETLLPMLTIPPNVVPQPTYPQTIDPRRGRPPPGEIAYLPVFPTDGLWARNFQPIGSPGDSDVSSRPFSELPSAGNSSTP